MNDHDDYERPPLATLAPPESQREDGDPVDDRLRRLEQAIAAMQDTQLMEQRLLERVAQRLDQSGPMADGTGAMVEAGRTLLPGMLRAIGSQFDAGTSPSSPDSGSMFSARRWILTDLIREVRTFFVMYFDYRYRPTLAARTIPPAALILFLVSWLGLRTLVFSAFIGPIVDYALNFFLVVLVYKTLQRESARYRSQVSTLPPI